jgi:hypothetical protein
LTGLALTIFRAGLALNIISSPVNGLVPFLALVAGFLMTTLCKTWNEKDPVFLQLLVTDISQSIHDVLYVALGKLSGGRDLVNQL